MTIHVLREDITNIICDVIVNPTNTFLKAEGSLDKKIHMLAGIELDKKCKEIGYCKIGDAVITDGYNMKCKYIFHTVGPKWIDGKHNEEKDLRACYKKCLSLAVKQKCNSIAFPIISSGTLGYPKDIAFNIAVEEIQNFLLNNELEVFITVFDKKTTLISKQLFTDVKEYIDDYYFEKESVFFQRQSIVFPKAEQSKTIDYFEESEIIDDCFTQLEDDQIILDESFSEALIRIIDEKGIKDSDCYKKANIDRKLFNKIKNNKEYHPKKETALSLAIALELDIDQTNELINKAGYILTNSYKFDVIIKYFINNKIFDVMLINETLYSFDQNLLY